MTRSRSAFVALASATLLLGACGGNKEANQGDVENQVEDQLIEVGYVAAPGDEPIEVSAGDAANVADCVGNNLFNPEEFTPEERDAVATASDGDEPDPDLVIKVVALVSDCYDQEVGSSGGGADDEAEESSDEDTTSDG